VLAFFVLCSAFNRIVSRLLPISNYMKMIRPLRGLCAKKPDLSGIQIVDRRKRPPSDFFLSDPFKKYNQPQTP
jgi:hypothetical protein